MIAFDMLSLVYTVAERKVGGNGRCVVKRGKGTQIIRRLIVQVTEHTLRRSGI